MDNIIINFNSGRKNDESNDIKENDRINDVSSNQQQGGVTVGIINSGNDAIKNNAKKKYIRWSAIIVVIASIVTILGYFGIKI
jgi:hypothetical protein